MGAVGGLVRRALRAGRRGLIGLAIVIAVAGGVSMTSVAGARRTASAFPRYLQASHPSDVAINVITKEDGPALPEEEAPDFGNLAERLPEVVNPTTDKALETLF